MDEKRSATENIEITERKMEKLKFSAISVFSVARTFSGMIIIR